jgi:hypothetical protein
MTCPTAPLLDTHEGLILGLMGAGLPVREAVDDPATFLAAREELVRFCRKELLPHLAAHEDWLVAARGCSEGRLLADAIRTEARAMTAAVYEIAAADSACDAVAATRVLHAMLSAHAHHEQLLVAAVGPEAEARHPHARPAATRSATGTTGG